MASQSSRASSGAPFCFQPECVDADLLFEQARPK